MALIITNRNFTEKRLNRLGAERDELNMEKLLVALRYEVVKHRDLTGKVLLKNRKLDRQIYFHVNSLFV